HWPRVFLPLQPRWIYVIDGIIVTVAEEIVIAGVEQLWIFAHEPAKAGVIGARAIFVEAERPILASGEQETIVVRGGGELREIRRWPPDARRAKHIVSV